MVVYLFQVHQLKDENSRLKQRNNELEAGATSAANGGDNMLATPQPSSAAESASQSPASHPTASPHLNNGR